jgi:hypothetical protein
MHPVLPVAAQVLLVHEMGMHDQLPPLILEPVNSGKTLEQMISQITPENIHGETSTGSVIGNESSYESW